MTADPSHERSFLRHTVATLAYRGGKVVRGAPETFADFRASPTSRTPVEILGHIGDLLDWALSIARGHQTWNNATPQTWAAEGARFHAALAALDDYLGSAEPLHESVEKLFQGPIADALTHVGQIALLRRIAGSPVRGENYHRAHIEIGRVGSEQAAAVREFD